MEKIAIIVLLLLLVGACKTPISDAESKNQDRADVVVKTDEGVMTTSEGKGGWCDEGADWSWIGAEGSAEWSVKGIISSGEYKGLCHIEYLADSPEGMTTMNYYISEDQESGYYEFEIPDGQKIKQEWSN